MSLDEVLLTEINADQIQFLIIIEGLNLPLLIPIKSCQVLLREINIGILPNKISYLTGYYQYLGKIVKIINFAKFIDSHDNIKDKKSHIMIHNKDDFLILQNAIIIDQIEDKNILSEFDLPIFSNQELFKKSVVYSKGSRNHFALKLNIDYLQNILNEDLISSSHDLLNRQIKELIKIQYNKIDAEVVPTSYPNIKEYSISKEILDEFDLYFTLNDFKFSIPLKNVVSLIKNFQLQEVPREIHPLAIGYIQYQQQLVLFFHPKILFRKGIPENFNISYNQAIIYYDSSSDLLMGIPISSIIDVINIKLRNLVSNEIYPSIFFNSNYIIDFVTWRDDKPVFHLNVEKLSDQIINNKIQHITFDQIFDNRKSQSKNIEYNTKVNEEQSIIVSQKNIRVSLPKINILTVIKYPILYGDTNKWIVFDKKIVPIVDFLTDFYNFKLDANTYILIYSFDEIIIGFPIPHDIAYNLLNWEIKSDQIVMQIINMYTTRFAAMVDILGFSKSENEQLVLTVSVNSEKFYEYLSTIYREIIINLDYHQEEYQQALTSDQASILESYDSTSIDDDSLGYILFNFHPYTLALSVSDILSFHKGTSKKSISIDKILGGDKNGNYSVFEMLMNDNHIIISINHLIEINYYYLNDIIDLDNINHDLPDNIAKYISSGISTENKFIFILNPIKILQGEY